MNLKQPTAQASLPGPVLWDFPESLPLEPLSLLPSTQGLNNILLRNDLTQPRVKQQKGRSKESIKGLEFLIKSITLHQGIISGYLAYVQSEVCSLPSFRQALSYKPFFDLLLSQSQGYRKKHLPQSLLEEIELIHGWVKESVPDLSRMLSGCHCWETEISLIRSYRLSIQQNCPLFISLSQVPGWANPFEPYPPELSKQFLLQIINKAFARAEKVWIAGDWERNFVEKFNLSPRTIRQAPRSIRIIQKLESSFSKFSRLEDQNPLEDFDQYDRKLRLIIDGPIDADMDLYSIIFNLAELQHQGRLQDAGFTGPLHQPAYWNQGLMIAESLGVHEVISLEQTQEFSLVSPRDLSPPWSQNPLVVFPSLQGVDRSRALEAIELGYIILLPEIPRNQALVEEFEVLAYEPGSHHDLAQKILTFQSEPQTMTLRIQANLIKLRDYSDQPLIQEYYSQYWIKK